MKEKILPKGWSNSTLGSVIRIRNGYAFKSSTFTKEGIPLVKQSNLKGAQVDLSGCAFLPHEYLEKYKKFSLDKGDILVGMSGSIGKISIYNEDTPSLQNQRTGKVEMPGDEIIDSEYMLRFLSTIERELNSKSKGLAVQNVSARDIEEIEFPVPPINEQRRIADKLDTTLAAIEACKQKLNSAAETIRRFRQSVLSAAVSGELTREWREQNTEDCDGRKVLEMLERSHTLAGGHKKGNAAKPTDGVHDLTKDELPSSWGIALLRDAVSPDRPITYGILKPGPELNSGVKYIRVADFPGNRLNEETIRFTSEEIAKQYERAALTAGDLLISIRGTVGRLIEIPPSLEGANITQDSARLSIQAILEKDFIRAVLLSPSVQERMRRATKGVAVRGINIGDLRYLQIPIPGIKEQEVIARKVDEMLSQADEIQKNINSAQKNLSRLEKSLLAKAFFGELVPQDPNDEPASVLLERIKAQREAEVAVKKPAKRGRKKKADPAQLVIPKGIADNHLAKVLEECGSLSERALLAASELEPGVFQLQLSKELEGGLLKKTSIDEFDLSAN